MMFRTVSVVIQQSLRWRKACKNFCIISGRYVEYFSFSSRLAEFVLLNRLSSWKYYDNFRCNCLYAYWTCWYKLNLKISFRFQTTRIIKHWSSIVYEVFMLLISILNSGSSHWLWNFEFSAFRVADNI